MSSGEETENEKTEPSATDEAFQPPTGRIDKSAGGPTFEPPSCEELTEVLEGIEVTTFIGQGGMGTVYSGNQPKLDRRVAIKILPTEGDEDSPFAQQFEREAQAMANMHHHGIVEAHDFGVSTDGAWHFIIMEYVHGDILSRLLEKLTFDQKQILAIITQICDGIYYAHEKGIIHRDIKPGNILLDINGQVKIADFGLAKVLGDQFDQTLIGPTSAVGSADFVAPEQLEADGEIDHRADIYSIGVLMYRMLTGKIPRGSFQPPSKVVEGIDPRLDEIVEKAVSADPDDRFQNIAELWRKIDEVGSGVPVPDVAQEGYDAAAAVATDSVGLEAAQVQIMAEDGRMKEVTVHPVASADVVRNRVPLVLWSIVSAVTLCLVGYAILYFGFGKSSIELTSKEVDMEIIGEPVDPEPEPKKEAGSKAGPNRPAGMSYTPFETKPESLREAGTKAKAKGKAGKGKPALIAPAGPDANGWANLLVDLSPKNRKNFVTGSWKVNDRGEVERLAPGAPQGRLQLDAIPAGSYAVALECTRKSKKGALALALPLPGHPRPAILRFSDEQSALQLGLFKGIAWNEGDYPATASQELNWKQGRRYRILARVYSGPGEATRILVALDGEPLIDWSGDASSFTDPKESWNRIASNCLGLGADSHALFHEAFFKELGDISPEAFARFDPKLPANWAVLANFIAAAPPGTPPANATPTPAPAPIPEAKPKSESEQAVDAVLAQFEKIYRDTVEKDFNASVVALNAKYQAALTREQERAAQAADLDAAVAVRDELAALAAAGDKTLMKALPVNTPDNLRKFRGTYEDEIERINATREAGVDSLAAPVDLALEEIQKDLTRQGKLDEAIEIKNVRAKVQSRQLGFTSPGAE